MNILSQDLSSHLYNILLLLAFDFYILTSTFFSHIPCTLFLKFGPSKLLQIYRLLVFDEYDDMLIMCTLVVVSKFAVNFGLLVVHGLVCCLLYLS